MRHATAIIASLAVFLGALVAWVAPARAVVRHAVVIGANEGLAHETPLRYAERDATRVATVLTTLGGFERRHTQLLLAPNAASVRRALSRAEAAVRASGDPDSLLLVFYSGHADQNGLHISGTRVGLEELRRRIVDSAAGARVAIIDACRSGVLTRVKGGSRGPSFRIDVDRQLAARGLAFLTSSAAGEDAQESESLQASFFTHYLISGLRGAADDDGDGTIQLGEAFSFAAEQTLAATAATLAGPQHPTYHVDLGGRGELPLTTPGLLSDKVGGLVLTTPGSFIIQRARAPQRVVGELKVAAKARRLALPAGRYLVTRRGDATVHQAEVAVAAGRDAEVLGSEMRLVRRVGAVAKGAEAEVTTRLVALAGARTAVIDAGAAPRGEIGLRWDWPSFGLEARIAYGAGELTNDNGTVLTHETGLMLRAAAHLRRDVWRFGLGAELGGVWLRQVVTSGTGDGRDKAAFLTSALVSATADVSRTVALRLDLASTAYLAESIGSDGRAAFRVHAALRALFGIEVGL